MSKATFDSNRYNKSNNTTFDQVLDRHLSRRHFVRGGLGLTAMTALGGLGLVGCGSRASSSSEGGDKSQVTLSFDSVSGAKLDGVVVPEGYSAQVLCPWGEPLNIKGNAWRDDGGNSAEDQGNALGMHHDGMHFFPFNGSTEDGLLCINHEYIEQAVLHPNGPTKDEEGLRTVVDEVRKEINAHGVTVVRIRLLNDAWQLVLDDEHNRRITADTVIDIAGPLAASAHLITRFSNDGTQVRGTLNNCGNGYTPWGTYLSCEENWPGYFRNTAEKTADQQRIGVSTTNTRYGWSDLGGHDEEVDDEFSRFDITPRGDSAVEDYRNEANGYGYIVEIDPFSSQSRPRKRTALGRFRHEGCVFAGVTEGQPVVFYSGHDSRFEYLYKFVSTALWDSADAAPTNRLGAGDKYMDKGILYVAKFNEGGIGEWLPLTMTSLVTGGGTLADHFDSLASIIVNTAGAADMVGATPMDRPEWCAVDPFTGSVYLTLTNNTERTTADAANPRINNKFGHIIRWDEGATASEFSWDIFLFGSPAEGDANTNYSGLTELNQLASPDGLSFDRRGILWVQTDNGGNELDDYTNNQMLAVVPSPLTDEQGQPLTLTSDNQQQLKRFFVGPNGCEVTGFAITPEYTSVFANIQHPSNWPYSDDAAETTPSDVQLRPRDATVVIRKQDGGEVGV